MSATDFACCDTGPTCTHRADIEALRQELRTSRERQARAVGYSLGVKFDALSFASIDEVQAGCYPADADTDSVLRAMYDGVRDGARARLAGVLVAG